MSMTRDDRPGDAADRVVRPLDPSEAYFFLLDKRSCMNFVVIVEREAPWPVEDIKRGLEAARLSEQALRVAVDLNESTRQLEFVDLEGACIPFREIEAERRNWNVWVESELEAPFTRKDAPLIRVAQLREPSGAGAWLLVTMHHCISDGRAAMELIQHLVASMRGGDADQRSLVQAGGMEPGMHARFPSKYQWWNDPGAARRMSSALLREAAAGGEMTELPWFREVPGSKSPRLLSICLNAQETSALTLEVKRRGASVHALLCAAQLLAKADVLNVERAAKLLLTCPVDMRQHVEGQVGLRPMQLYASMLYWTYIVAPDRDVWDLAAEVMQRTRLQLDRGDAHYFYNSREVAKALAQPDVEAAFDECLDASPPGSVLSAVGKLQSIDSDPLITNVSFAICSARKQVIFSAASSYRGRMQINLCYDEASLLPGIGPKLGARLREHLLAACGAVQGAEA